MCKKIKLVGMSQHNLKNVSLEIEKGKIIVFTGVSGSGKSSIVFDTIAAESSRQLNETFPAFVRCRLPKHERPKVDVVENLSPAVVIDQNRLGGNARSTVGTITDLYSMLRVVFSRVGIPHIKSASCFSFNDPKGMCPTCCGMGKVLEIDFDFLMNKEESLNTGITKLKMFQPRSWYWKAYVKSGLFDVDKKLKDYSEKERNLLYYGAYEKDGKQVDKHVEGIINYTNRLFLNRDRSGASETTKERIGKIIKHSECPLCHGKRLNQEVLSCKINGYSIADLSEMEITQLIRVLDTINDSRVQNIIETIMKTLQRMIDIGLPYLNLNRDSTSLSGGEAQRIKLVRYLGSSLTGMIYIFDEPSTGMHPRDVYRMTSMLKSLRDKGNTVLVVEHDKDVIKIADEIVDVGPYAGKRGGRILFQGSYEKLLLTDTLTAKAMKEETPFKDNPRIPKSFLPVKNANLHNLKNVSVDIPLGVLTVVTGVAGSGKSTLIKDVFAKEYEEQTVIVDQSPITATNRSTPASYLGFFDEIRKILAKENQVETSYFSFNSKGGCPVCAGKGVIVTELVFMDPVVTVCEECEGRRYSNQVLEYRYHGKNIVEIMDMTVEEAMEFFCENKKICKVLKSMEEVGLKYLTLGQPLSTLSGGERQRIKLAKTLYKKGNIYVLDEPTTGLHASDITKIMSLLDLLVKRGNTVIVIEHNIDVMRQADYIIDIGPDGGNLGGEVVFTGTPKQMALEGKTITAKYI